MIYTHIFLVILVTVILIIFAEYQNLRKISWILFIGCVTYILLMIEPETTQPTNNEYDEYTIIDSTTIISQTTEFDTIVKDFIAEPKNTKLIIPFESDVIDEIQNIDISTIVIATNIVEKTPLGVSRLFLNDIDALYCFTAVDNTIKNNKIIHNWKRYEQNYFKSTIRVGDSPNWRCWSRITIRTEMVGDWQVIVTDSNGNRLDSIEFSIIPTSE